MQVLVGGSPAGRSLSVGRTKTAAVLLIVLVGMSLARVAWTIPEEPQSRDAGRYVRWGENLVLYGVYGIGEDKHMQSAPLLSASIAVGLRLDPRHADFRESGVLTDHRAVRQVNLVFIALLHGASVVTALMLLGAGRRGFAVAALTVLLTHFFLLENPEFTHGSLQELPTAAILGWTNITAIQAVRTKRLRWMVAVGLVGGVLTLSRAVFLYILPVFVVLLVALIPGSSVRRRLVSVAACMLGLTLVVGPWLGRNVIEFGEFSIADQGGKVLLTRDVKNGMTPYQHRGAWVHFSPDPVRPLLARALGVDLDDFLDDGPLRPLVRWLPDPETGIDRESTERRSFFRQAGALHDSFYEAALASGVGESAARSEADRAAITHVVDNVRRDPLRFIRTTPVFLYRSAWPMNLTQLWEPTGLSLPRVLLGVMNPVGFLGVLAVASLGLVRRRPQWFALCGLATGMILYHGLLTHALYRYTRPAAGLMLLIIAMGVVEGSRRLWASRAPEAA